MCLISCKWRNKRTSEEANEWANYLKENLWSHKCSLRRGPLAGREKTASGRQAALCAPQLQRKLGWPTSSDWLGSALKPGHTHAAFPWQKAKRTASSVPPRASPAGGAACDFFMHSRLHLALFFEFIKALFGNNNKVKMPERKRCTKYESLAKKGPSGPELQHTSAFCQWREAGECFRTVTQLFSGPERALMTVAMVAKIKAEFPWLTHCDAKKMSQFSRWFWNESGWNLIWAFSAWLGIFPLNKKIVLMPISQSKTIQLANGGQFLKVSFLRMGGSWLLWCLEDEPSVDIQG